MSGWSGVLHPVNGLGQWSYPDARIGGLADHYPRRFARTVRYRHRKPTKRGIGNDNPTCLASRDLPLTFGHQEARSTGSGVKYEELGR